MTSTVRPLARPRPSRNAGTCAAAPATRSAATLRTAAATAISGLQAPCRDIARHSAGKTHGRVVAEIA